MSTLLIKNIKHLISCDDKDSVYSDVDLFARDGWIEKIGPAGPDMPAEADEIIDATDMLCYPGLVNTHHHLYQQFSRNLPEV